MPARAGQHRRRGRRRRPGPADLRRARDGPACRCACCRTTCTASGRLGRAGGGGPGAARRTWWSCRRGRAGSAGGTSRAALADRFGLVVAAGGLPSLGNLILTSLRVQRARHLVPALPADPRPAPARRRVRRAAAVRRRPVRGRRLAPGHRPGGAARPGGRVAGGDLAAAEQPGDRGRRPQRGPGRRRLADASPTGLVDAAVAADRADRLTYSVRRRRAGASTRSSSTRASTSSTTTWSTRPRPAGPATTSRCWSTWCCKPRLSALDKTAGRQSRGSRPAASTEGDVPVTRRPRRPDDGVTRWRDGRPVYDRGDTVCVIGAGASGLAAIKNLREHGFGVDCYERETGVGGAWNWRHDRSPVYASTHLISSKPFTQFPDFPMPDSWPDYPHHSQVLAYLERYADHFGLREHIWFGTEVVRVEPAEDGPLGRHHRGAPAAAAPSAPSATPPWWSPTGTTGRRSCPAYEGLEDFRGEVIHAVGVQGPGPAARARVLVVGAGNTGCDIAVEAAQQAPRCWHSTRRGYWYAPKYVFGRPADQVNDLVLALRLPLRVRQWLFHRTLRLTVGDLTRFGLPEARPQGLRDPPDRQQPARLLPRARRDHPGAGRRPVPPRRRGVHRRPGDRARPGRPRHRLPAAVRVPRPGAARCRRRGPAAACTCTRSRRRTRRWPWPACCSRTPGCSRWCTGRPCAIARWLRLRETGPGAGGRVLARGIARRPATGTTGPRSRSRTRHWFEVSHADYLRALQTARCDELEPAA